MSMTGWETFLCFFKVGAVSFGGGPPSIPLLHKELVDSSLLTEQEFTEGLALGTALPGPIITNMAVYAGLKFGGVPLAVSAVAGALLPTVFIMGIAVVFFIQYYDAPALQAALKGIRPAVIALLAYTIYKLLPGGALSVPQLAIAVSAFTALLLLNLHPALIMAVAGIAGVLIYADV